MQWKSAANKVNIGLYSLMLETYPQSQLALLWGNFRNLVDFSKIRLPTEIILLGTHMGEFPVDSHKPIFLEVPKETKKQDISSRSYTFTIPSWSNFRIVSLPNYQYANINSKKLTLQFREILQTWNAAFIPEEIPCIAFAFKMRGNYCDEREAQYIKVIVFWSNNSARILELEWFEGPLDDCISPEWYISTSQLITTSNAINELEKIFEKLPHWSKPIYSIYCKPSFILNDLSYGEFNQILYKGWKNERNYRTNNYLGKDIFHIIHYLETIILE